MSTITEALETIAQRLEDPDRVVLDPCSLYESADGEPIWPGATEEPCRACLVGWVRTVVDDLTQRDRAAIWTAIDTTLEEEWAGRGIAPQGMGYTEALELGIAAEVVRKAQAKVRASA